MLDVGVALRRLPPPRNAHAARQVVTANEITSRCPKKTCPLRDVLQEKIPNWVNRHAFMRKKVASDASFADDLHRLLIANDNSNDVLQGSCERFALRQPRDKLRETTSFNRGDRGDP
ncbi:hypothetical protein ACFFMR_14270 [Micromonospora andamanensis]|uniref:hypothetical protein n=1 Tax=Micromonospora andamanensis TaxID=1287068 RepID=UPI001950089E|nr:hypothetical protein [Micromonospora andamanensis]